MQVLYFKKELIVPNGNLLKFLIWQANNVVNCPMPYAAYFPKLFWAWRKEKKKSSCWITVTVITILVVVSMYEQKNKTNKALIPSSNANAYNFFARLDWKNFAIGALKSLES